MTPFCHLPNLRPKSDVLEIRYDRRGTFWDWRACIKRKTGPVGPRVDAEGKVSRVPKSSSPAHLARAPLGASFLGLNSGPPLSLPLSAQDLLQRDSTGDHVPIPLREFGAGGVGPGA